MSVLVTITSSFTHIWIHTLTEYSLSRAVYSITPASPMLSQDILSPPLKLFAWRSLPCVISQRAKRCGFIHFITVNKGLIPNALGHNSLLGSGSARRDPPAGIAAELWVYLCLRILPHCPANTTHATSGSWIDRT